MKTVTLKVRQTPVVIRTPFIRLDALLKLSGAVLSGGEAKFEIQSGRVEVDGAVCTQRGKKLIPGQTVVCGGKRYIVTAEEGTL